MRTVLCLLSAVLTLAAASPSDARDANHFFRADRAIARSLYASAAHERYGPILPAAVLDAEATEIAFTVHRGPIFDTVYHASIRSRTAPMHFRGWKEIVSFATSRIPFMEGALPFPDGYAGDARSLIDTVRAVIAFRIEHIVGGARGRRGVRERILREIEACARATTAANVDGAVALETSLRDLPPWPWGYPDDAAKSAIRTAASAAFAAHPPRLPVPSSGTPTWCSDPL